MARRIYDPLAIIPAPEVIRTELEQVITLAKRLRILLDVAVRIRRAANQTTEHHATAINPKEVAHG